MSPNAPNITQVTQVLLQGKGFEVFAETWNVVKKPTTVSRFDVALEWKGQKKSVTQQIYFIVHAAFYEVTVPCAYIGKEDAGNDKSKGFLYRKRGQDFSGDHYEERLMDLLERMAKAKLFCMSLGEENLVFYMGKLYAIDFRSDRTLLLSNLDEDVLYTLNAVFFSLGKQTDVTTSTLWTPKKAYEAFQTMYTEDKDKIITGLQARGFTEQQFVNKLQAEQQSVNRSYGGAYTLHRLTSATTARRL